jgi:hypothetical protein
MDVVLGNAQFIETVVQGGSTESLLGGSPPAKWYGMAYLLWSAGVRVAIAGGTDRACMTIGSGPADRVRTYVLVDEALSYASWTAGLAAGRTSTAAGPTFLRLRAGQAEVGSDVRLASPQARATLTVELQVARPIEDCIELVVDNAVRETRPVSLDGPGTFVATFEDVSFPESAWVAARLCSKRAHTGALYVIVDGRPIVDPLVAEYWMLWCDVVAKANLDHPELSFFGPQEDEALALIAQARGAFKTLRDARGLDGGWRMERYGASAAACRGPIVIGANGPARSGQRLLLTCVNAPPEGEGVLILARGSLDLDPRVGAHPDLVLGTYPARSTRSGYAEVALPPLPAGEPVLHARFYWTHPRGCRREGCDERPSSDALVMNVQR